ncbi:hypothetical protein [Bacillus sp. Marseille-P3661]|uniref:hypothetical protein n=1 Tax=Bacillus sp. Marseille-P3661 TaxID=1936234 RepID=UPI000C83812B|nr:hypothetical protein [Bacillus sp. Marseille-P3661]
MSRNIGLIMIFSGLLGFSLVFFLALNSNTVETAIKRGLLSFLLFYLICFILWWVITASLTNTNEAPAVENKLNIQSNDKPNAETFSNISNEQEIELGTEVFYNTSQYVRELLEKDQN